MSDALVLRDVHKRFGRQVALRGLSCRFPSGRISAFVGPNGAGKTTAFSIVGGFLQADEGTVDILGEGPFDPWRLKSRLGVLPQDALLPDRHSPRELLVHLGRLQGLGGAEARRQATDKIRAVQLDDRADHAIRTLSHGMRRRVAVATALVGDPELVLLDEPTAGLDPVQAHALRSTLLGLRGRHTLVVSSHDLGSLERLCDWVVMLDHGACVTEGPLAQVTGATEQVRWQVVGEAPLDALRAALPDHRWDLEDGWLLQRAPATAVDASSVEVLRVLADHGVGIREVRRGSSLEEAFLDRARK